MAAIVHEELGVEEFRSKFWPSDPIYLNSDKSFFCAINDDRKVLKQGLLSACYLQTCGAALAKPKQPVLKAI